MAHLATVQGFKRKPKSEIPRDEQTAGRDKAADFIQTEILDKGKWGDMTVSEIAEEADWSREHIRQTLIHSTSELGSIIA